MVKYKFVMHIYTWSLAWEKNDIAKSTVTFIVSSIDMIATTPTTSISVAIAPGCQYPSASYKFIKLQRCWELFLGPPTGPHNAIDNLYKTLYWSDFHFEDFLYEGVGLEIELILMYQ